MICGGEKLLHIRRMVDAKHDLHLRGRVAFIDDVHGGEDDRPMWFVAVFSEVGDDERAFEGGERDGRWVRELVAAG